jgi:endonuclease G
MSESFLLTNTAPQTLGFNRGIWKRLETEVRGWAVERGDINVCAGPVYLDDDGDGIVEFNVIGHGRVEVPDAFFKIVVARKYSGLEVIAFIMRNKAYPPGTELAGFIVPVDEIEVLTGLDFLNRVDDEAEGKIESVGGDGLW